MTIGERIKERRIEKGITQDDLATMCGVSRQTVYKWEVGISLPDTNNIVFLANALGFGYDELIDGKIKSENQKSTSPEKSVKKENGISHNKVPPDNKRASAKRKSKNVLSAITGFFYAVKRAFTKNKG